MASGLNAKNGQTIEGIEHLRQSIQDILTTPVGSRVMRREYGSKLFDLIDAPMNQSTMIKMYAATADAIAKWEPRFKLVDIKVEAISEGKLSFTLQGEYIPEQKQVVLQGIII